LSSITNLAASSAALIAAASCSFDIAISVVSCCC
jgi:hypothetical protein